MSTLTHALLIVPRPTLPKPNLPRPSLLRPSLPATTSTHRRPLTHLGRCDKVRIVHQARLSAARFVRTLLRRAWRERRRQSS